jgi:hypothetical protein
MWRLIRWRAVIAIAAIVAAACGTEQLTETVEPAALGVTSQARADEPDTQVAAESLLVGLSDRISAASIDESGCLVVRSFPILSDMDPAALEHLRSIATSEGWDGSIASIPDDPSAEFMEAFLALADTHPTACDGTDAFGKEYTGYVGPIPLDDPGFTSELELENGILTNTLGTDPDRASVVMGVALNDSSALAQVGIRTASGEAASLLPAARPGEPVPFLLTDQTRDFGAIALTVNALDISVETTPAAVKLNRNFRLGGPDFREDFETGTQIVTGTIENLGPQSSEVRIVVALYDENRRVVAIETPPLLELGSWNPLQELGGGAIGTWRFDLSRVALAADYLSGAMWAYEEVT